MKKFLIIGNANAVKHNGVFPHIVSGEVFIRTKDGVTSFAMHFKTPDGEIKVASALWYTNLDSRHLYKELNLTKEYSPEEYPKYENYDAIEVDKVKNIPVNYDGVMGVPISVLLYYLEGYEIIGHFNKAFINGKQKFERIFIKKKRNGMKKFLIIGNMNAITYQNVFPYIKNNELWLGYGKNLDFILSDGTIKGAASRWFTNLDNERRYTPIDLYKCYNEEEYHKYDNYDAIEVSKVCEIPMDYDGVMGVPITFLDKYCPQQFEIVGNTCLYDKNSIRTKVYTSEECIEAYFNMFGKEGCYPMNSAPMLRKNGFLIQSYKRILIKRILIKRVSKNNRINNNEECLKK